METNTASEYKHSLKRLTASVIHICSGLAERVSEGPDRENRLLEFQMMNMLHTLVQLHVQSQRKQNSIACMDAVTGKSAAGSEQNSICQQHEMVPEMEQFQALLARKPLQNRYCAERTLESLNYLSSCYMQPANKSEVCKESSNYQKESGSRDQKIHESFEDFEIIKDEEEKQKDREYMEWQHMQDWQVVEEKTAEYSRRPRIEITEEVLQEAAPSKMKRSSIAQPPVFFNKVSVTIGQAKYFRFLKSP